MSQSQKVSHVFGSILVKQAAHVKLGSTGSLEASSTPAPTILVDANATITVSQLRSGVLVQTPTTARTLTLPTAALTTTFLKVVGDSFDFYVINEGLDGVIVTVAVGTGGTAVGALTVADKFTTTFPSSGTSKFRVRSTNVTSGSEAYVVYRLA
jgi:hypothetical protein